MVNTLKNLARETTNTTGTGTVSLTGAVAGYLTFTDAGVSDADVVTYAIHEGSNSEVGQGTYTASGATLSRDTVYASTNAGSQISLSGNAEVFITAAAEDFASLVDASGTPADSQVAVWTDANTVEGAATLTYDGTSLLADGTLLLKEQAAAAADQVGYGQIWVKNDTPNVLQFTDDAGTDFVIATTATGYVDTTGTPADNQVAVFTDANTVEGDAGLTYASGVLQVGSGDSGATIDAGADNFLLETSTTADIGFTISDGGTASKHSIHLRTSDDDYGYLEIDHDGTATNAGVVLGYNDGATDQYLHIDYQNDLFLYTDQAGTDHGMVWIENGATATTSGTTVDVTGIPAWAEEIYVGFDGVSSSGTDPFLIQLGDAGGIETTGYVAHVRDDTAGLDSTAGFVLTESTHAAADAAEGAVIIRKMNGNKYSYESHLADSTDLYVGGGTKTTSATLTQIRLTTTGGTDTFDAGNIYVKWK